MGVLIGILWFDVFRIRRKLVIESLHSCFPEWDLKKVVKTGRASLIGMGISIVEFIDLAFITKEDLLKRVSIEGEENVRTALAEKKGLMIVGAHMSNGDMGIAAMSAYGYPMHLISKRFSSLWLDNMWFRIRGRFGTQFISPRNSSYDILKALRGNGAVIFVLDQFMGPPLGVRTTFFGRPTGTAVGLALFAERTKAPVVPSFARREKNGNYVVYFGKPIPFEERGDKNTTLQYMTQKYTDRIEQMVRDYPDQWMWLHRRWKPFNE